MAKNFDFVGFMSYHVGMSEGINSGYWTPEKRLEQSRRLRERKIWLKSTGPRTAEGKRTSSRNSYKHGRFTYEKKILFWYTRLAAMRLKQIRTHFNLQNQNHENELRIKYGLPMPSRPDIRAFYPYFKIHPLSNEALFPPKKPRQPTQRQKDKEIFDFFTSLGKE